jgi:hypothetical protein
MASKISDEEHAFWRALTLPQEERYHPWDGIGYRWFRSPNVVPIEQWRRAEAATKPVNCTDAKVLP